MSASSARRRFPAALIAAACFLPLSARAEETPPAPAKPPAAPEAAPAGMPAPQPKFACPFADGLVGAWSISGKAGEHEMKGVSKWAKAADGVVLVEELRTGEGEHAFFGLGVTTLGADGKTVTSTWFDTEGGADAWVFTGTLADDGWDLTGDLGQGKVNLSFHRKGDALVSRMFAGDQTMFEMTYTKETTATADLGRHPTKAVKHPFSDAMVGTFDGVGAMDMGGQKFEYKAELTWRPACGGTALVADMTMDLGPMGMDRSFAVARLDVEAKVMKFWGWSSMNPPGRMTGPVTDTTWDGTSLTPTAFGDFKLKMTKTATGFSAELDMGGMKGTETHTRRK